WRRVLQRAGEHGRATARIRAIAPGVRDGHAGDPWKSPASHQVFITAMGVDAQVRAFVTRNIGMVTDSRKCEQCGVLFTPRREHARFCSARCRVAWNRLNASDPPAEGGALGWTITAMRETIDRLLRARGWDRPNPLPGVREAVWWVAMVYATLVRYRPDAYDSVLSGHEAAERQAIEGTFGGLRFVRNQMGYYLDHADFIEAGRGTLATWAWAAAPH